MINKEDVLTALSVIQDPDLNDNIVALNFVKNLTITDDGIVSFDLELTTPACPVKDLFVKQAKEAVFKLPGVKEVKVTLTAQQRPHPISSQLDGLKNVKHILAVSSCKGGVGKSTCAVNVAFALKEKGAKVGIFDADIYGPSLPTMVAVEDTSLVLRDGKYIQPVDYHGVKLMSFGYTQEPGAQEPAILRGPMVTQIINQLLTTTEWGELDYLVVDMPPGTGDIQITLCQLLNMTAAVIVTTPQYISFIDVVKGIEMFDKLKVPTIGVIENMSYFDLPNGEIATPFGEGASEHLVEEFGFKNVCRLPIVEDISRAGDNGIPFVCHDSSSKQSQILGEFVDKIIREISKVAYGRLELPKVSYDEENGVLIQLDQSNPQFINPKTLRLSCRSAKNQDEFTGKLLISPDSIPDNIAPLSMNPVGNYALGVNWSDGHSSLFPYDHLLELAAK